MPTRKLLPKETKLQSNSNNPARQKITPNQAANPEWKKTWVVGEGKLKAEATIR